MDEIKHYDKAAHDFYQKQNFIPIPLLTWDLFAENYKTTNDSLKDLVNFNKIAVSNKWDSNISYKNEVLDKNYVVIVTDKTLNIIHTTKNIYTMSGYTTEEILGKKPKIFQGKLTCKKTISTIGKAVKNNAPFEETVLNYRKDGSTYNCWIKGNPIKNTRGNVVNFIAFEKEIS